MIRAGRAATLALAVAAAGLAGAAGCAQNRKAAIIKDDSPQRNSEAYRLALEAQRAQSAGRPDQAIALYHQSLDQSQDLFWVWNNLGLLLMQQQNYLDASKMFRSAADLAPTDPRPYFNLGVAYQNTGWPEQALDSFIKSLDRNPRYVPSLRGSIGIARVMKISDEPALQRVRTLLMVETDPKWRRIAEFEQFRLNSELKTRPESTGARPPIPMRNLPGRRQQTQQQEPPPQIPEPELQPMPVEPAPAGPTGATGATGSGEPTIGGTPRSE